jgi:hypothetical protein
MNKKNPLVFHVLRANSTSVSSAQLLRGPWTTFPASTLFVFDTSRLRPASMASLLLFLCESPAQEGTIRPYQRSGTGGTDTILCIRLRFLTPGRISNPRILRLFPGVKRKIRRRRRNRATIVRSPTAAETAAAKPPWEVVELAKSHHQSPQPPILMLQLLKILSLRINPRSSSRRQISVPLIYLFLGHPLIHP